MSMLFISLYSVKVLDDLFFAVALFLVHFLHLHSSVLKPDFDLSLRQVQHSGHLVSPVSC